MECPGADLGGRACRGGARWLGDGPETSAVLFGATVSAPVFGAIVEWAGSYQAAWLTLAAVLALAFAILLTQTRRPEPHLDTDPSIEPQAISLNT